MVGCPAINFGQWHDFSAGKRDRVTKPVYAPALEKGHVEADMGRTDPRIGLNRTKEFY